jgi:hypothetical protein
MHPFLTLFILPWLLVLKLFFSSQCLFIDFQRISSHPVDYAFQDIPSFDARGGHIQGIQLRVERGDTIVYLSGSSSLVAYMAKAHLKGGTSRILSIDTLLMSPYRHAGGFQIFQDHLAVGIEDNHLRNSSKVLVYELSKSVDTWTHPVYTLERSGSYERSTAGAVGITSHQGSVLLVVADWDARNLDFYAISENDFRLRSAAFRPIATVEIAQLPRQDWSDPAWHSYQNLNLVSEDKTLYLVGFAKTSENRQVADIFSIEIGEKENWASPDFTLVSSHSSGLPEKIDSFPQQSVTLKKLGSKTFIPSLEADFKAAGGLHYQNAKLAILSAPYQLDSSAGVNIFHVEQALNPDALPNEWKLYRAFYAKEAHQAAAADSLYFYAINNTQIGQYERKSGELQKLVSVPGTIHLNSGFFLDGLLYMAHSNYPQKPDQSDIRSFDPRSGNLCTVVDFGETDGSLTWLVNHQGQWWGMFAHYKENNAASYLVKWDSEWQEISRFTFPKEVLRNLGTMSVSGGVAYREGFLITGHDDREVYYVKIPNVGTVLEYGGTFPAPFTGQGIAIDPVNGGLIGIDRKEKKVLFALPVCQ